MAAHMQVMCLQSGIYLAMSHMVLHAHNAAYSSTFTLLLTTMSQRGIV